MSEFLLRVDMERVIFWLMMIYGAGFLCFVAVDWSRRLARWWSAR